MTVDRRPLACRDTRWANALATHLARKGVSPNSISIAGLVAGVAAGVLFAGTYRVSSETQHVFWLTGAVCVQLRLLANLLDGMVALASERTSKLGELFNELPDRISDAVILIGLGYAKGGVPELGFLAAIAALLTAYVRAWGKSVGTPQVFAGPMAKQHRMACVTVAAVVCAVLPAEAVESYSVAGWAIGLCFVGALVTAVRRVIIIVGHLW